MACIFGVRLLGRHRVDNRDFDGIVTSARTIMAADFEAVMIGLDLQ